MNTSTKRIHLGNFTFLDWDEIESDTMAKNWYTHYQKPTKPFNMEDLMDSRLIGIVDLGDGNWQAINPFASEGDYDSHAEKFF